MPYRGIVATQEHYAAAIAEAGVRSCIDPRRLEIPGALVMPERAELQGTLACNGVFNTEWVIHILGGPTAGQDSVRQLSALTALVLLGMETDGVVISWESYRTDDGTSIPSIALRWTTASDWIGPEHG